MSNKLPPGVKAWPEDAIVGQYGGCFLSQAELVTVASVQGDLNALNRNLYNYQYDSDIDSEDIVHSSLNMHMHTEVASASSRPGPNVDDRAMVSLDVSDSD